MIDELIEMSGARSVEPSLDLERVGAPQGVLPQV
jgi:hypothetical protein